MMAAFETRDRSRSCSADSRATAHRWLTLACAALLLPITLLAAGCAAPKPAQPTFTVAAVDSVLGELGGPLTDSLSREQRWRLISSMGTGLPPQNFQLADLPEAGAYGANMLHVYCTQCHWLPSPQMHSATEWPLLVHRMLLRSQMLHGRLGGPVTQSLVGNYMVDIMKNVGTPSPEQVDSLLAYLQRNALPVAQPTELGSSADARVFVEKCSVCHQTPSPGAHTAGEWAQVVPRMQSNMARMGVPQLSVDDVNAVMAFLKAHARR